MSLQQQKKLEENYGDVAVVQKTNILALNADKSNSFTNNQHSSLKERYSNSPYSNGAGVARAMR